MTVAERLSGFVEETLASEGLSFVTLDELLSFTDVVVLAVADQVELIFVGDAEREAVSGVHLHESWVDYLEDNSWSNTGERFGTLLEAHDFDLLIAAWSERLKSCIDLIFWAGSLLDFFFKVIGKLLLHFLHVVLD